MRRGHPGIGGWRNENPRHFRPRNGGNPHFRPSRNYSLLDFPRFPPPSSRSSGPQFNSRPDNHDEGTGEYRARNRYRNNRQPRHNDYNRTNQLGDRQTIPFLQQSRHSGDDDHRNSFSENIHINSMGDVDHRQLPPMRNNYRQPFVNPWSSESNEHHPVQRSRTKSQGSDGDTNRLPSHYTGHRPPASDHYGCNPTSFSTSDNSHSFSRSVDDTVDIVRRRLLNRNDPQHNENYDNNQNNTDMDQEMLSEKVNHTPNIQQDQPTKKRLQRQKHNEKSATIKNKIVHELFKMDKGKLHKLMDNPNSSHKFEYAISSLITESQNSFNRHLRSTAEKSLCSSSEEFMQNDSNTIYEDTFLKQMQCILDPQDTVFLEDLKPMVMAELSKVLQIDEYEQKFNISEDDNAYAQSNEQNPFEYLNNEYGYDNYARSSAYPQDLSQIEYMRSKSADDVSGHYESYEDTKPNFNEPKELFERRARRQSYNYHGNVSTSPEKDFYDRFSGEKNPEPRAPQQYFDANTEQFSDEEDPFAELDQQYHVAVDHDFIENDDISIPNPSNNENNTNSGNIQKDLKIEPISPDKLSKSVIDEIDSQLQDMAKSPLKLSYTQNNSDLPREGKENNIQKTEIKTEMKMKDSNSKCNIISREDKDKSNVHCVKEEKSYKSNNESQDVTKENENINNTATALKSSTSSNSRKRSIEQRPSHRKEKRKKVETEPGKQILNKNIIINVNDCASKATEKCEAPKSIFNLFFPKEESKSVSKDSKKVSPNDKNFTEKHVRRKATPKKPYSNTRKDSTSSQGTSPQDNDNMQSKSEVKASLKTIDLFTEQPKKMNIHQAHRNTAPSKSEELSNKTVETKVSEIKIPKLYKPISRQLVRRHVAVQVVRKLPSKQIQTETKKFASKGVQTDYVPIKAGSTTKDAFERMKEIDLEIQVLLQEKFKLYNSLESRECGVNSIESKESTLGMTLLNVLPSEFDEEDNEVTENLLTEDNIVDEFTSIPVEELEQIALSTIEEQRPPKSEIRTYTNRRRKNSNHSSIQSSCTSIAGNEMEGRKRKNKNVKSPNISLIEQIITDDRPLEDIISLDDLEMEDTKAKSKKKQTAKKKANKSKSKKDKTPINFVIKECSVLISRIDITPYLKLAPREIAFSQVSTDVEIEGTIEESIETMVIESQTLNEIQHEQTVFEETVLNDIQLDMLDVSEDIVVGDMGDVKYLEDKAIEIVPVPISEDIILDNSQSSVDDATPALNQGEECKIYDYSTDENLRRDSVLVAGNADAVLAIECVESNFLAAGLDGNVYYFNNEGQLITTLRGSNLAVTCLTIVKEKHETTVYTGSLDSRIRYYDLETGLEKGPECNVLSPIQTMDRAWDTVFVGTRTGFVLQFECKNNMLIPVSSVKFSDQSILALRAMKEGPRKVLLVAARSENVTIKDAQTGLLLRTLVGPKMTVYTLLYEDGKVYCGTSSQQIHVFDYTSGCHVGTHSGGKGAVCLRACGGLVFAGCYDGCVYVYREGEGQPFAQIRGPSLMLLSLAVVGTKIIAGYKDRSLYIWKIPLCILQEMIL